MLKKCLLAFALLCSCLPLQAQSSARIIQALHKDWLFFLGDDKQAAASTFDDAQWRKLNLPHDWSIEGVFAENHLTTTQGGALPTGIGWYRKHLTIPYQYKNKQIYLEFDGVYRDSEVWINGHSVGKRPFGYNSFRYEISQWIRLGEDNVIAVRVDNSQQPNSRWYSGSGIYRYVRLVYTEAIAVDHWGTYITTPKVNTQQASVKIQTQLNNTSHQSQAVILRSILYDAQNQEVKRIESHLVLPDTGTLVTQNITVANPLLWTLAQPYLYSLKTEVWQAKQLLDVYQTSFGIRSFRFDAQKGFILNEQPTKILGVCNHHDLGALGAAVNVRAIERQLTLLKQMGCNAIRMSHNPPAPELLDLCDKMGFIVMDEAFDMWKKKKSKKDYGLFWEQWHQQDLEAMVKRDRNHPSIFVWSIGNEIREQFDSTGTTIAKELAQIVKKWDNTRPVISALTENEPNKNFIYQSKALDLLGFNYKHEDYALLPQRFPQQVLLATETASALATRGRYDMPKDSIQLWPKTAKSPLVEGNAAFAVTAYDNVAAYWGTTHEEAWKAVKKSPFIAGLFVWSGFDYLGEPHPYPWPARSSYFGIIDLAGFPKDVYYMYQSEWTNKPVLHLFPHWNWTKGQTVDVWCYYNEADEVELLLNEQSLGIRKKEKDAIHVAWKVPFQAGTLKAVSRKAGQVVLTKTIQTAGKAYQVVLETDKKILNADGEDLAFVTVKVTDEQGNLVPEANHLINFQVTGAATLAGVDNGYQASMESFKMPYRHAYNGLCLAIVRTTEQAGTIQLTATAEGLLPQTLVLESKK